MTWDIKEIKKEHFDANIDKEMFSIIKEPDGTFGVYQQTAGSVAPYFKYVNAQLAAARVLQLLGIGPIAPQYWPEEVGVGSIDYKPADILELKPR